MDLDALIVSPFFLSGVIFGALGAPLFLAALVALVRLKPFRVIVRGLAAALLLALGLLLGTLAIGIQGYRALTHEEVAARIDVQPVAPKRFTATFHFPDGATRTYEIAGDAIYVDAHILKWKPVANFMGLHTAYELDRVGGRYAALEEERNAERSLYALRADKPVDLFELRRRYSFLEPLLDAEYGSASFVPVSEAGQFELRVSTSGLLIRPLKEAAQ
nr:MAG: hypothetical protein DIU74_12985 [Pseudomonadota bacterium]